MSVTPPKYLINGYLSEGAESDFLSRNRAFRLGDGFFETIRVVDCQIPVWDAHYKGLSATCVAVRMEMPPFLNPNFSESRCKSLCQLNKFAKAAA